jgi:hypothetical protein
MIVFRHAGRVTLILGLAWFGLAACGSSDGDLFGSGNPVDAKGGEGGELDAKGGEGGEPDDGSGGLATGGRSTGGAAPTGGVSTGGAATGGRNTGGARPTGGVPNGGASTGGVATAGKPGELSCADLSEELAAEIDSIQACESDDECGQPLQGTSCGCTRNLVARKDADIGRFEELRDEHGARCDGGLGSICDCPAADGYKCSSNRCGWNYQKQESCTDTAPGQLCLKPDGGGSGATLKVGQKLAIQVQPKGCFSSSCTQTQVATCSLEAKGDDFAAKAEFCLGSVQGGACTADCGGGHGAECQSEVTLTEGAHTVTLGDMSLTFTVPGTIPEDAICSGDRF